MRPLFLPLPKKPSLPLPGDRSNVPGLASPGSLSGGPSLQRRNLHFQPRVGIFSQRSNRSVFRRAGSDRLRGFGRMQPGAVHFPFDVPPINFWRSSGR